MTDPSGKDGANVPRGPSSRSFRSVASNSVVSPILVSAALGLCLGLSSEASAAQPGIGGPGGPGGPGAGPVAPPGGGQRRDKKEGPAEEAPKDKEALKPIEPVPAQPRRRRQVQLFELHGYFRTRADYFHRLNLDLDNFVDEGDRPFKFFSPPAETPEVDADGNIVGGNDAQCFNRLTAGGVSAGRANTRCNRRKGAASANLRLRLEPSLHISDTVSAHAQVDVLDNVVLGSTPGQVILEDPTAPLGLYTRTQRPPNDLLDGTDSVVAKRAWGRIKFGFGLDLQFGRMPWSWGMGMVANHGNGYYRGEQQDIIRYVDRDYGDSVDSIRLAFDFGKDRRRTHTVAVSWDWASSGPTTAQLLGPEYFSGGTIGQQFSVEKFDNVYQWSLSLERRDKPEMLERKLSLGNPVVNYGLVAWLRYQDVDAAYQGTADTGVLLGNMQSYINRLVQRQAFIATPDLWMRVNWRTLRVELEASGNFGSFRLRDIDADVEALGGDLYLEGLQRSDLERKFLAQFGYAFEFKYGLFNDRFHIGFDQGFATGDTAGPVDGNPLSPLNVNDDNVIGQFRFNPAYNIDLLLFREILGTVSNAAYFKPWAAFYFFDHFSVRADVQYAMAARRQSTLGNKWSYGIELDGAARYHDKREPIFFQVQYGVLFPLGAFNRIRVDGPREDARAVQTFQAQLGIRF